MECTVLNNSNIHWNSDTFDLKYISCDTVNDLRSKLMLRMLSLSTDLSGKLESSNTIQKYVSRNKSENCVPIKDIQNSNKKTNMKRRKQLAVGTQ